MDFATLGFVVDASGAQREVRLTTEQLKALANGGEEAKRVLKEAIPTTIVPPQVKPALDGLTASMLRMRQAAQAAEAARFAAELQKLDPFSNKAAPPINRVADAIRRTQQEAAKRDAAKFAEELAKVDPFAQRATGAVNRYTESIKRMQQAAQAGNGVTATEQSRAGAMASMIRASDPFQKAGMPAAGAAQIVASSAAAEKAAINFGRLREGMNGVFNAAVQLGPGVSQLASVLASMTVGSALTVGIMAGIAAIGWGWNKLTEDTRKAKQETADAIKTLGDLRDQERLGSLSGTSAREAERAGIELFRIQEKIVEQQRRITEARRGNFKDPEAERKLRELIADQADQRSRIQVHENAVTRVQKEKSEERLRAAKEAADREKAAWERHYRGLLEIENRFHARRGLAGMATGMLDADSVSVAKRAAAFAQQNADSREAAKRRADDRFAIALAGFEAEANAEIAMRAETNAEWNALMDQAWAHEQARADARRAMIVEPFSNAIEGIQRRFSDMFSRIFGTGRSVFQQLAGEVAAMFASAKIKRAMAAMMAAPASGQTGLGGLGNQMLRDGAAGAFSGLAGYGLGYGVGSATQSRTAGVLGGAASGAAAGAMIAGPVGALVGGLTGAAGGFIGASNAAKRAAEETRKLRTEFDLTFGQYRAEVNGQATDLSRTIAQIKAQKVAYEEQIQAAYAGTKAEQERSRLLTENAVLEHAAIETAKQRFAQENAWALQDVEVRKLRATGFNAEADMLALAVTQQREYETAVRDGKDETYKAALAEAHRLESLRAAEKLARDHKLAQDELNLRMETALGLDGEELTKLDAAINRQREYNAALDKGASAADLARLAMVQQAEQVAAAINKAKGTIEGLSATIDGLQSFKDQLLLSDVAGLSPNDKLAEAKRQYDLILAAAKGGDAGAAGRLPAAAQAYLQWSREVDASGQKFQDALKGVLADTDAVMQVFKDQRTIAQKQLDELIKVRDQLAEIWRRDAGAQAVNQAQAQFELASKAFADFVAKNMYMDQFGNTQYRNAEDMNALWRAMEAAQATLAQAQQAYQALLSSASAGGVAGMANAAAAGASSNIRAVPTLGGIENSEAAAKSSKAIADNTAATALVLSEALPELIELVSVLTAEVRALEATTRNGQVGGALRA